MEAPVKAALIGALTALFAAAAQITSQWLLALRAEKRNKPEAEIEIKNLLGALFRRFFSVSLIVGLVVQILFIGFTISMLSDRPLTTAGVAVLAFQIAATVTWLAFNFIIDSTLLALRYALTGSFEKEEVSSQPSDPTTPSDRGSP